MVAIPSKFVEYLKMQEVFKLPYEMYTWGEIYSLITEALIGLCTSMKVHNLYQSLHISLIINLFVRNMAYIFQIQPEKERKRKKNPERTKGENPDVDIDISLEHITMSLRTSN